MGIRGERGYYADRRDRYMEVDGASEVWPPKKSCHWRGLGRVTPYDAKKQHHQPQQPFLSRLSIYISVFFWSGIEFFLEGILCVYVYTRVLSVTATSSSSTWTMLSLSLSTAVITIEMCARDEEMMWKHL